MVVTDRLFIYYPFQDDSEKEYTAIRLYGLNEQNETICLIIDDFTPSIQIELPEKINWVNGNAQALGTKLDSLITSSRQRPIKKVLRNKYKLYGANMHIVKGEYTRKVFPYLKCSFSSMFHIRNLERLLNRPVTIPGIGSIKFRVHEQNTNPILQMFSTRQIPTAGWISFVGNPIDESDKITLAKYEYKVNYESLNTYTSVNDTFVKPKTMSFDIEVNSSDPTAMPQSMRIGDKIFQISCIIKNIGDPDNMRRDYLLTLGDPSQEYTGPNVTIMTFKSEGALLKGFTGLVRRENPNIMIGYNIFTFDIPYMIDRAKLTSVMSDFDKLGFHSFAHAKEKTVKWNSKAYKDQEFKFLEAEGRLFIDFLPIVKRDFKLENYRLKTVSSKFLGETKDPLTPQDIFRCYRVGMKGGAKGSVALGIIGKYCIQDSVLVLKLMEVLQTWPGLCEMARVCNVPIFTLYTQGQQIRVFSQTYLKCLHDNCVVEKDAYIVGDNERYVGAHVFDPIPGVYDEVLPFDFKSLYPTLIIAYNICYSTWVTDPLIPDSMCHVMEWDDHIYCLAKGTKVGTSIRSKNIEDMVDQSRVYGITPILSDVSGVRIYDQSNHFNRGVRECNELTFQDGTTLICTPDHRIMNANGDWIESQNLKIGESVKMTIRHPSYDIPSEYSLSFGGKYYTGDNLIMLLKLIGLICSDGHLVQGRSTIYVGHQLDIDSVTESIRCLFNVEPRLCKENYGWSLLIKGEAGLAFREFEGVSLQTNGAGRAIPDFLLDCPDNVICAFLSGLFGGDGHTLSFSKKAQAFSPISFSWTEDYIHQLDPVFSKLETMLRKVGFHPTSKRRIQSITGHSYKHLSLPVEETIMFHEKIGFAHCVHKSVKLEAGCLYLKYRTNVWNQYQDLINKCKVERDVVRMSKKKVVLLDILNRIKSRESDDNPIYSQYYYNPSHQQLTDLMRDRKKWCEHFPRPLEYMEMIGALHLFENTGIDINSLDIPTFNIPLVHIRKAGLYETYDIEVKDSHSFVANGIIVHNCSHDPKMIRKEKLDEYILEQKNKIKKLRDVRNSEKNKDKKASIMIKIVNSLEKLKPYTKERSDIIKGKKVPMCEHRKYRFLKEPRGIIPTLIQNLLDARAKTRREQSVLLKQIKESTDEIFIRDSKVLWGILEQRQLAYKISANSMYGAFGVSKGYLPLMPAAMCVTYMGRTSIEKVAHMIQNEYGGQLIYGDTDTCSGSTPVLIRTQNGYTDYVQLKDLNVNKAGERFGVLERSINGKEVYNLEQYNIEVWNENGWSKIKYIMRHKTTKQMYRVLTHTGVVDVTEDHSLLDEHAREITPKQVHVGMRLLHRDLPRNEEVLYNTDIPLETIWAWGFFMADGTCGYYSGNSKDSSSWNISNQDNNLLNRAKLGLELYEKNHTFTIDPCMESSHVNKLNIRGSNLQSFVKRYEKLFYTKRSVGLRYKKVPSMILMADMDTKRAFYEGWCAAKKDKGATRFDIKGQIGAAGLFHLSSSLGYNVSIQCRKDKLDIFRLTLTTGYQRLDTDKIKKIMLLGEYTEDVYDLETVSHHFGAGVGRMIVHNSNYVHFPQVTNSSDAWDRAIYVAKEISKTFPAPMELEFENANYKRFFIITKKRYMYRKCGRDGIVDNEIGTKGVLLARRDGCRFVRGIYEGIMHMIFDKKESSDIIYYVIEKVMEMMSGSIPYISFSITKEVNSTDGMKVVAIDDPKAKCPKGQIGSYKVNLLPSDPKKRELQLVKKNAQTEEEYYLRSLPAHVQLAEKMKRRGYPVDNGTRLEYLLLDIENVNAKQYEKIESFDYFKQFSQVLRVDYTSYAKQLVNPIDQIFNVMFIKDRYFKPDVISKLYKTIKTKRSVMDDIKKMGAPILIFEDRLLM
jgi:DNA polymerase elongation subunit (family B)